MTRSPEEIRRRRARAIVFAAGVLAILAGAQWSERGSLASASALALPLGGLGYCVPSLGRAVRWLAARPLVSACLVGALASPGPRP